MGDRIVAAPVIGMVAVAIVASVPVTARPVAADTDEHILAMITRIVIRYPVIVVPGQTYQKSAAAA